MELLNILSISFIVIKRCLKFHWTKCLLQDLFFDIHLNRTSGAFSFISSAADWSMLCMLTRLFSYIFSLWKINYFCKCWPDPSVYANMGLVRSHVIITPSSYIQESIPPRLDDNHEVLVFGFKSILRSLSILYPQFRPRQLLPKRRQIDIGRSALVGRVWLSLNYLNILQLESTNLAPSMWFF